MRTREKHLQQIRWDRRQPTRAVSNRGEGHPVPVAWISVSTINISAWKHQQGRERSGTWMVTRKPSSIGWNRVRGSENNRARIGNRRVQKRVRVERDEGESRGVVTEDMELDKMSDDHWEETKQDHRYNRVPFLMIKGVNQKRAILCKDVKYARRVLCVARAKTQ